MASSSKNTDPGIVIAGVAGIVIGFVAIIAIGAVLNGWVLSFLWRWFIVDVFGVPALTVGQAIGVSMVARLLTSHPRTKTVKDSKTDWGAFFAHALVVPFVTLGIAFVVKQFV